MFLLFESFIALFFLILAYYRYKFQHWKKQNCPYVKPKFPWGNYPNVFHRKANFGEILIDMYDQMKKQGHQYFGIYLFSQPCFVPIHPTYVKLIMAKDFPHFSYRNFYCNEKDDPISAHLISLNGEKWRKLRTKLTPTFTTGKIKMVFKTFVECGKSLEKTLEYHHRSGTPIDVKEMFSDFSSDVIVNCAFGVEVDKMSKIDFNKYSRKALDYDTARCISMYLGAVAPDLCRKLGFRQIAKSSSDFFINVVKNTVDYREKNKVMRNDFLQMLIDLKNDHSEDLDGFTIEEVAAQCFIFFLAGFETSATTMAYALFEVARNPHVYKKAVEEIESVLEKHGGEISYDSVKDMTYLGQIVDETLRLHSPVYSTSRICTKNYNVPGTNIFLKKGSQIIIPIRALQRDPEFFPEPEKFDPDRFHPDNRQNIDQFAYIPFGEGPRICIGIRFALMEVRTALVLALRNYKFSVNPKTIYPFKPNPITLLYDAIGGIWIDCEKVC